MARYEAISFFTIHAAQYMAYILAFCRVSAQPLAGEDTSENNRNNVIAGQRSHLAVTNIVSIGAHHHPTPLNKKSGRWDSNPRMSAWKADALPLGDARIKSFYILRETTC